MEARAVNIYWRDAISEGLKIIKVGKALVALRGVDRLRVFWLGEEAALASTTINWYIDTMANNTTEGGHHAREE